MSTQECIPTLSFKLEEQSEYINRRDAAKAILDDYEMFEVADRGVIRPEDAPDSSCSSTITQALNELNAWDTKDKWARAFLVPKIG